MSDIKLPQGSDYHGNGRYYTKKNTTTKLTLQIEMLERQLKDAWERNEVQNKYWHNIGVERNSLKESQPKLLKHIVSIEKVNAELKEKYAKLEEQHATNLIERNTFLFEKERLETELYFCNRNNKVGEIVDERT